MAIPKRLTSHGTFFISAPTQDRRRVFQRDTTAQLFLDTLHHYANEGRYDLHAFVIMPDHVHLLLTPAPEISLEKAMQFIKGGFSFQLKSKLEVWTRSFNEHRIRTPQELQNHVAYIEQNPVRARLVEQARDYKFSSLSAPHLIDELDHSK